VPSLRRELADYYGGAGGVYYYRTAIDMGRQHIRPSGPSDIAAAMLADAEATRLRDGDLRLFDDDLCSLLAAAHPHDAGVHSPAAGPTFKDWLRSLRKEHSHLPFRAVP
jgi:hypothetical protein